MKITTKYILFENEMMEYGTVCKKGKTIRELEEKLKKKDNEIEYLRSALNDILEEKEYVELEEENTKLKKEKEKLEYECEELEEENNKLTAELKEVKSENMKLNMEIIAKEMKKCINPEIIKAASISLKSCLNAIDLLSNKGEK